MTFVSSHAPTPLSGNESLRSIPALQVLGGEQSLLEVLRLARSHLLLGFLDEVAEILLVRTEAEKRKLVASTEELQKAVDHFRVEHQLHKAQLFSEWLQARNVTLDDMESWAVHQVLRSKLKAQLADEAALARWMQRASAGGEVPVARLVVDNRGLALELVRLCHEENASFEALIQAYSKEDSRWVFSSSLPDLLRSEAHQLSLDAVSEPIPFEGRWYILRRGEGTAQRLSAADLHRAQDGLFSEWLLRQKNQVRQLLSARLVAPTAG